MLKFLIISCLWPQLVRSGHVYQSYQTGLSCESEYPIQFPTNVVEIQNIIKEVIAKNLTVKGIGNRHSQTDIICTEGIPISLQKIDFKTLNADSTVTVGSGANLTDICDFLKSKKRSLIHLPWFSGLTAGGAIGSGAHGSSLRHISTLSDQAVKFTIVDGTGEIRIIESDEEMKAFRVHLGLLGIIVDVTLETVPLFKMTMENTLESENILFDGTAIREAHLHDYYQLSWYPHSKSVVVYKGEFKQDISIPGDAKLILIPDYTEEAVSQISKEFEYLQSTQDTKSLHEKEKLCEGASYSKVEGIKPTITEDGETFVNPATGYAYNLVSSTCTSGKCQWHYGDKSLHMDDSSMAFHIDKFDNVITNIKEILAQIDTTFPFLGIIIRFCKPSESYLSLEYEQETVHLEWFTSLRKDPYTDAKDGLGAYQAMLQMMNTYGGRSHWAKSGLYYHSKEILAKTVKNDNLSQFVHVMKKYDPKGIFMNRYGKRLIGESNEFNIDTNVKHCAIQDYCLCIVDSDCATYQKCSDLNGYKICRNVNISTDGNKDEL